MEIKISKSQYGIDVGILINGKIIGSIELENDEGINYTIVDATIDEEYRGKGYYKMSLFKLLDSYPNIKIHSVFRSKSAEMAWKSLIKNLPTDIKISKKDYPNENTTLFTLHK